MRYISYTITEDDAGKLVGDILRTKMGMSRKGTIHAKYMDEGLLLDGVRVRTNQPVAAGQVIKAAVGDTPEDIDSCSVCAQAGPVDVVYEDDDVCIVNKQAGMATYPCGPHKDGTLGNFVLGYFQAKGKVVNLHPVHRLDATTSGLIVFATNAHAQNIMQQGLHSDAFVREYLAICVGSFPAEEGVIEAPIGRICEMPATWAVVDEPKGKMGVSHYRVLGQWDDVDPACGQVHLSLVKFRLETGRTHQIRVHSAYAGAPLLGDSIYGRPSGLIVRPALHSAYLTLKHPLTGEVGLYRAPLPDDMRSVLQGHVDFDEF